MSGYGGLGRVCSGPFRGVCQGMAVAIRLDEARRVVLWRGGFGELRLDKEGLVS